MPINILVTATLLQNTLDRVAIWEIVTGWMDASAGQVIYNEGVEVKIPKMSVQGLEDCDRDNGYQQGGVTLEYETRKMTQDRGHKFQIDPIDVNESNFVTTAATVAGEFQRTLMVPEIDTYHISKIATETVTAEKAGMTSYGYIPGITGTSALWKVKEGIKAIRELYSGPLVIYATPDMIMELEMELSGEITGTTFSEGGIETTVPSVDEVPIISASPNRIYMVIIIYDGKTSEQEKGGYVKGIIVKDINFFVCPRTAPIAVTKQDTTRIFDPAINQKLNTWQVDYRRFHDIWVPDNKLDNIYLNIKDAAPSGG